MSPLEDSTKRKRVRVDLFEESGMTEQQRRQVRHKQRCLHEKIEQGNVEDDDKDNMHFLSKARDENNKLFDSVRFTREAVLDAENGSLIVSKTRTELDKLRQVARFDADKLSRTLRSKLSEETTAGRQFNWALLGSECGICFNAAPSGVRFLAGSIDTECTKVARKARAKRQDNKQEDGPEVRPEVMDKKSSKGDADALSAAEKVMKELDKLLKKKCKHELDKKQDEFSDLDEQTAARLEEHGSEVDGVKFLMNPKSFTQTVENIFNFSFLVKKGRAAIGVRNKMESDEIRRPGLWVQYRPNNGDAEELESRQAVVSFTMADWRRICEAHQLEKGDIPHRTGSRHNRAASQSQSQQE